MSKREFKGKSLIDFPRDFTLEDIETTGLDLSYNSIIEVSALRIRQDEVVDQYSSLMKPEPRHADGEYTYYVDSFIEQLTGITNDMLRDAPETSVILKEYNEFIGEDVLIGHNVNFDINFLYDNTLKWLDKPLSNDFVDTMRLSRRLLKELPHHRLKDLSSYYGVDYSGAHRSLTDCKITLSCYKALINTAVEKYSTTDDFIRETNRSSRNRRNGLKASDIRATVDDFDKNHPLYDKICVFTGSLEKMARKEAMQMVVNLGGSIGDSVTAKTNYLILGNKNYSNAIKEGKSSKLKKAEKLMLKGQDLQILSENVFYDMIDM